MARLSQSLTLAFIEWSDAVAELLGPVAARDALYSVDAMAAQASAGVLRIFGGMYRGKLVAAAALRVDNTAAGRELVIVAAAGRARGASLIHAIQPVFDKMAADAGCVAIRVHSNRAGMGRMLWRHGFNPIETVYRKMVSP